MTSSAGGERPSIVILCGGTGTRLREETEFKPKPMVEIGRRPILWHILKHYAHYGFNDFILALGHKGQYIRDYFFRYDAMVADLRICTGTGKPPQVLGHTPPDHFNIDLIETGPDTMTGGRLRRVREHVRPGTLMLTYGDAVADVNIEALLNFHRQHKRIATVTCVHPMLPFGKISVDAEGLAQGFIEKPQMDDVWINGGYFVFEPEVFDYLDVPSGDPDALILERAPMEKLARDRQLVVYKHEGFWACMDTFKDVERLNSMWQAPSPPWKIW